MVLVLYDPVLYDPVLIFSYLIYYIIYIVGYDAGIIVYCVIVGYDEYDILY